MRIGQFNTLKVLRVGERGLILQDPVSKKEALLPAAEDPGELDTGDAIRVFVYVDGQGGAVATRKEPLARCGQFAYLRVAAVTRIGAFLDWGLPKDLLAPYAEQSPKMVEGESYMVYVYLDEVSGRPVASARLQRFLGAPPEGLRRGREVELLIHNATELGVNVIIEDRFPGLLFFNDFTRPIRQGERMKGYIKAIKEGGKVDVSLQAPGYAKVPQQAEKLLAALRKNEGFLPLHDKSDPTLIFEQLHMSKKTFKKAVGALLKEHRIRIAPDGIHLSD